MYNLARAAKCILRSGGFNVAWVAINVVGLAACAVDSYAQFKHAHACSEATKKIEAKYKTNE